MNSFIALYWYTCTTACIAAKMFLLFFLLVPVPGGCNREFYQEYDPSIEVTYDLMMTSVKWQNANEGDTSFHTKHHPICELPQNYLHYDLYVHYMPQGDLKETTFLDALQDVLTAPPSQGHKVSAE